MKKQKKEKVEGENRFLDYNRKARNKLLSVRVQENKITFRSDKRSAERGNRTYKRISLYTLYILLCGTQGGFGYWNRFCCSPLFLRWCTGSFNWDEQTFVCQVHAVCFRSFVHNTHSRQNYEKGPSSEKLSAIHKRLRTPHQRRLFILIANDWDKLRTKGNISIASNLAITALAVWGN